MKRAVQKLLRLVTLDNRRTSASTPTDQADSATSHSCSAQPDLLMSRSTTNTTTEQASRQNESLESDTVSESHGTSISLLPEPPPASVHAYEFSVVPGYFIDYVEAATLYAGDKVITQPRLGLLDRAYDGESEDVVRDEPQWGRFARFVERLNEQSTGDESYKLFFIVRHGFGVHNQVMEKVGSLPWKDYWSHLDGDGELVWADAHLVPSGVAQAQELAQFWIDGVEKEGMPLPGSIYTSPLARCLETTQLVYTPVFQLRHQELRPKVKELLREFLTDHTCDRRSTRTWIHENYPDYIIEEGFQEQDTLWSADKPETFEQHVVRKQKLLEDIFMHESSPFISLTTHSYAISALLKVIGAPKFRVAEGAMVPLFVRAKKTSLNLTTHT